MYQYPYGNAQQLNLDWILSKLQELEAGATEVNIEEVANALIAASFDAGVSYRRYDYCFYNGKLYRALNDTSGAFNPSDWLEVIIGDDIPVLTRLLNAVDTSLTSLQTTVGNQGNDITNLQNALNDLDSDDVDNASNVTGTSVSDALDNLNGAITSTQSDLAPVLTQLKADTNLVAGDLRVYNNQLYRVIQAVSSGASLIDGTNITGVNLASFIDSASIGAFGGRFKTPDGLLIQWGAETGISVNIDTAYVGGLYRDTQNKQVTFPIPFKSETNPFVLCFFSYSSGTPVLSPTGYGYTNSTIFVWFAQDYYQRSGNDGRLVWVAFGRWK